MTKRHCESGLAAAAVATALLAAGLHPNDAAAQTAAAPQTAGDDADRIITPRRNEAAARVAADRPTRAEGEIDWPAVRQRIESTRLRDAEHQKRVAAAGASRSVAVQPPPPPGGVQPLDPSRLQSRFVTAARARATAVPLLVPAS
ncbi:MAG: hypothetical protein K2Q06_04095, partial [Parvularculaceae bacterium]|nr:hypothetical protein [Parvularculaceae bacterium]